ncbi:MAG TPA: hypothetical protein PLX18_12645 [Anaerohalosphaeraceae bacterium]|nr:hypothetical protein [Anaerohalosphaeraceae bacterium]HQG07086.1 hypothetical protein [Anaerohalosphaeraceae bacterium]HQI08693.1 hypothetical protein [Anaerohalosphaeraceae bacterium]HQJ69020.1 hypothetical protein [Anaerohalosphaeraceae bacterium]
MKISNKYVYVALCISLIVGISVFCNRNNSADVSKNLIGIFFEPALLKFDPDSRMLAFSPSEEFLLDKDDRPRSKRKDVYVFDVTTQKLQKVINNSNIHWLAWQPCSNRYNLWVSTRGSYWGFWPRYILFQIGVNEHQKWQTIGTHVRPKIVSAFYWNPEGTILAGKPEKDFFPSRHVLDGNIAVSWNEGRDAIYYEGVQSLEIFWIDENTFITQDAREKSIHKFFVGGHTLSLVKTFSYGKDVYLFGAYEDKPVYQLEGNIYIGDEPIYDSKISIGWLRVKKPYVYFNESSTIVIFNVESREEFQIDTTKEDVIPVGLSLHEGTVYWLSERKEICRWNFKDESAIESVLKIDSIKIQ